MALSLSLIGYGEAGQSFARAAQWRSAVRVFDVKPLGALYQEDNVEGCASLAEAVAESPLILSLVTAEQALAVARDVAQHLRPGTLFCDMNSVAPDTKRRAAGLIQEAGGHYIDVAIMSPVEPARLAVPLLVSGPSAVDGCAALSALGFSDVRRVGSAVGRASSIKMIRSVMIKGQEALTAEMMLAANKAGVAEDVLASLGADWPAKVAYNLERMTTHGLRRAAEMEEAAKTLEALGVAPLMTRGTIIRQREMAA
jgi:3-hydroxyisobutyrate dehydrogenase-like beta-hydroxyacid dehydrogenase